MCLKRIQKELDERGISVSQNDLALCRRYVERILFFNKNTNLTAITTLEEAFWFHIFDSLLLLPFLQEGKCIDVGTGGGFPGVLLAIVSKQSWVLLDSKQKKIQIVQRVCEEMHMQNVLCKYGRVEEFASTHKNEYKNVVARALAKTDILLEYASPLQPIKGKLIVPKAHLSHEEKAKAKKVAKIVGYELIEEVKDKLPQKNRERTILVYEKSRQAMQCLPRRTGMALKKSLAEIRNKNAQ